MRPLDPVVDRLEGAAVAGERRAGGEADDEVHRRAEFDEVASLADRWEYAEPARFGVDRHVHEAVERQRYAIGHHAIGRQRGGEIDRKSTRLNTRNYCAHRMPASS